MLRTLNQLTGFNLVATDDEIGRCKDFLFDDRNWVLRYMVADTHKWLPGGRKVLISPIALQAPDWDNSRLGVNLSRQDIESSPPLDEQAPVSRQYEIYYSKHFNYNYYWIGPDLWGNFPYPAPLLETEVLKDQAQAKPQEDSLRSINEVNGYNIQASDESIGHVEDYVINEDNWSVAYLVVDTRNWLPGGRNVLISPEWLKAVSWADRCVYVDLTAQQIKDSPEYHPQDQIDDVYETQLREHYGRHKP